MSNNLISSLPYSRMMLQNPASTKFVKTYLSSSVLNIAQIILYKAPGTTPKLNEMVMEFHTSASADVTANIGILIVCRLYFQNWINPNTVEPYWNSMMCLRSMGKERLYDSLTFIPVAGTQVWFQVPSINCHQNSCRLLPGFSRASTFQHHWDPTHRFWRQGTFQGWCSSAAPCPWVLPVNRFTVYWHC